MNFKYKFTVFTPCYNSEKTLHRVFDSLMSQTIDSRTFEWLVINDASTDNTHNLVEEYIKKADFDINYINLGKNQMLIKNIRLAIDEAKGEYFLGIGHDDGFLSNALEIFDNITNSFDNSLRQKCASIVCLSQRQDGQAVGEIYPQDREFIKSLDYTFKLDKSRIGENWGVLKRSYLQEFYTLPKEIDEIRYIPESFFWTKMALDMGHLDTVTYMINDRLRIYYIEDSDTNMSTNVRSKYSNGFEYESLYFLNNYQIVQLKYSPKFFVKHLIKYILTTSYNKKSILKSLLQINNMLIKCLYVIFLPVLVLKQKYFK